MPSWKWISLPRELITRTNAHRVEQTVTRLISITDSRIARDCLLDFASKSTPFDYVLVTCFGSLHSNAATSQFAAMELLSVLVTPQDLFLLPCTIPCFLRLFRNVRRRCRDGFTARLIRIAEARLGDRHAVKSISRDFTKPCGIIPGGMVLYRMHSIQCLDRIGNRRAHRTLVRIANLNVHESDRINAAAILAFHGRQSGVDLIKRERLRSDLSEFEQTRTLFLLAFSGDDDSMRQIELLCHTLPLDKPLKALYQQMNLYRCLTKKQKPFFDRLIGQIESRFEPKDLPKASSVRERRVLTMGR